MKGRKKDIMGDFSSKKMYDYVKNLYSPVKAQIMINATLQANSKDMITFQAAMKGLKKLATAKAYDTLKFSPEILNGLKMRPTRLIKGLARELGCSIVQRWH